LVVPSTFLALEVQLVVLVSAFMVASTVWQFFVCCSSTHGTLVCKSGGTCHPMPYGVGATASAWN